MKLDNLKQLVKEEIKNLLNENIQVNLSPSETGTYEIKYIIMALYIFSCNSCLKSSYGF